MNLQAKLNITFWACFNKCPVEERFVHEQTNPLSWQKLRLERLAGGLEQGERGQLPLLRAKLQTGRLYLSLHSPFVPEFNLGIYATASRDIE
jgi:hypothetical protein